MIPAFLLHALMNSSFQSPTSPPTVTNLVSALDTNYLYASGTNWQQTRTALLHAGIETGPSIDHALKRLHDADLRVVTAEQLKMIQQETAGRESGIGLVDFALTSDPSSGEFQVVSALVGSSAYRAGLRPADRLIAINGKRTISLSHEQVMTVLRGSSGCVSLTVERAGVVTIIRVPREEQDVQAVVFRTLSVKSRRVGYIGIRLFTFDSGKQVRQAVQQLTMQGVDSFIVDLRNNPGGYLTAMATASSAFTAFPVGWKISRSGTREPISSTESPLCSGRLIVLVNAGTASAAEALAVGLRDDRKAVLVGAATFGRGQIQTYVSLNDTEGVIVPTATIESPSGNYFNKRVGVRPDYTVASTNGNKSDVAIRKALSILANTQMKS